MQKHFCFFFFLNNLFVIVIDRFLDATFYAVLLLCSYFIYEWTFSFLSIYRFLATVAHPLYPVKLAPTNIPTDG